jgi:hypothetical protein
MKFFLLIFPKGFRGFPKSEGWQGKLPPTPCGICLVPCVLRFFLFVLCALRFADSLPHLLPALRDQEALLLIVEEGEE